MDNTVETAAAEERVLATLPLRGISVFPDMLLNFDVERPMSIAALNAAMSSDQNIFLVAQRDMSVSTPTADDLYKIGTISRIKQILRIPGSNSVRVMVQGLTRAKIVEITATAPCFYAKVEPGPDGPERASSVKTGAMIRQCCGLLDEYIQLEGRVKGRMKSDRSHVVL